MHAYDWFIDNPLQELESLKLALLSSGADILDLSMINPDLAPARLLLDRLSEGCIKAQQHRYAVSRGIRKLREAFCIKYATRFAVNLQCDTEVCVTFGSKDALPSMLSCLRSLGYKSKALLCAPVYPGHVSALQLAGYQYESVANQASAQETLDTIRSKISSGDFGVILLNFPSNPSGCCVDSNFWLKLCEEASRYNCYVLNDFVYGEMCLNQPQVSSLLSAAHAFKNCAETYSLSKAYSVPGWRVGAALGSAELISLVARLKAHQDYGIFLPIQMAAAAALSSKEDLVRQASNEYNFRAQALLNGLRSFDWETQHCAGLPFVWCRLPQEFFEREASQTSLTFCVSLLKETGVALLPGEVFGADYRRWLRISLVAGADKLRQALSRIAEFVK